MELHQHQSERYFEQVLLRSNQTPTHDSHYHHRSISLDMPKKKKTTKTSDSGKGKKKKNYLGPILRLLLAVIIVGLIIWFWPHISNWATTTWGNVTNWIVG